MMLMSQHGSSCIFFVRMGRYRAARTSRLHGALRLVRQKATWLRGSSGFLLALVFSCGLLVSTFSTARAAPEKGMTGIDLLLPHPWPMHNLVRSGTLTVATTAKDPPRTFVRPDGELDGTRVTLFRQIAHDLGLHVEFVRIDWAAILPGLLANRFDMACEGVQWSPDRLGAGGFLLTRPVTVSHVVVLVPRAGPVKAWSDLNGRRVGGIRGETEFMVGIAALKQATPIALIGQQEGVLAVMNKQVEGLIIDETSATALLKQNDPDHTLQIIRADLPTAPESLCVNAREPELLEAVDILLTKYRVEGLLARINTDYGAADDIDALGAIGY
ncbi:amino acid ABC transporter substrate-binding protein [Komagataeibacter xylinus]|uniref:Amino acid ABC transporter substrate-binding protein n=2 Tax=Komagataeibacter xylinus TaxID=28448 RepID=A0A857FMS0_KOMXY|nr:amino acid ABC transporter substrate-binding protein [Komagataeibacter xylinus]